jgi:hypothetical protein
VFLDGGGFFDVVVNDIDLEKLDQNWPVVAHFELQFAAAADHLLRGNPVGYFGKGAHEFDTTA